MSHNEERRSFLKSVVAGGVGAAVAAGAPVPARAAAERHLRVWSCGGLAEAMRPAHDAYTAARGVDIAYTGAFAGVLGKSLLSGNGTTEVFGGRVLALAKNLRKAGRMLSFRPLCFTSYVIVTPKGNPAKIAGLEDMARPGVRVAMCPKASPPGGAAVMGILKKAGLTEGVMKNVLDKDASCIQRTVDEVTRGRADAMIVERRLTCMPLYQPLDVVEIPEKFFPEGPLTFTLGIMSEARDMELARDYVDWMVGPDGQAHFEKAGFITCTSDKGRELIERLGVKDVA